jgi:tRNA 5-methylaminomethyl-2-thiouridine biosynthesis bifunctional protein
LVRILPTTAVVEWKEGGLPCSAQYGDVYYSAEDGLAEARHVFLAGNGLPERLKGEGLFTVAETGFGTGLNFLALWQVWKDLPEPKKRLRFISVELHPMRAEDMARAHAAWPGLAMFSDALQAVYPHPFPGGHVRYLEGGEIELHLWFGDVLECSVHWPEAGVDAWFLDGFAPAGNEGMWQQALYAQMARSSKVGASVASFTAAGHVRRGLEAVGFAMQKARGYGRKRDMLVGRFGEVVDAPAVIKGQQPAIVIGGGLAGVGAAWHLAREGREVLLLEAGEELCAGASGNPAAAFTPYFTADWSERGQLYARGFGYTRHIWRLLEAEGFNVTGEGCGVLALDVDEPSRQRHEKLLHRLALPSGVMRAVNAQEASVLAGIRLPYGGVFYGEGGWISMKSLCHALLAHAGARVEVMTGNAVSQLEHDGGDAWRVAVRGHCHPLVSDHVVLASGFAAKKLLPALPLEAVRGQLVQFVPPDGLAKLKVVLNWGEYLAPRHEGRMVLGSSFVRHDEQADIRPEETQTLLERLGNMFPDIQMHAGLMEVRPWAATRCATPQRMPLIGEARRFIPGLAEGLYLHLAHGSRGSLTGLLPV